MWSVLGYFVSAIVVIIILKTIDIVNQTGREKRHTITEE